MAISKTPRHIYDEAMQQAYQRVAQSKWPALQTITNKAETEMDAAVEAERANSFELGRSAGYEDGYNHGYRDGMKDRIPEEDWADDPRKPAIDKIIEEEE